MGGEGRTRAAAEQLPVSPRDHLILLALSTGELHGYALMREIEALSGSVRMDPANLYRALRRLEREKLVVRSGRRPAPDADDERRRYYAITPLGRSVVSAEAQRLEELTRAARRLRLLPGPARGS